MCLLQALYGCESLWFEAVEFVDEGCRYCVAEACVEVDLSESVHPWLIQGARRPASVLLRDLLGLAYDPDFFEALVTFLYLLYRRASETLMGRTITVLRLRCATNFLQPFSKRVNLSERGALSIQSVQKA